MDTVRCSLLIPCRNAAAFLPALFEGVRGQRVPFEEIILWDDGSSDQSADVAEQLGARVLRSKTSVGPATARNELVKAAACEWVHLHDADDLISPSYLARLGVHAAAGVDVVACDADWIDLKTRELVIAWRYSAAEFSLQPVGYLLTHPLCINNCLYRRSSFLASGGYNPKLVPWEDADFHVRMADDGRRFVFVPEVLTWSLRHESGISMNYLQNWEARLRGLQGYALSLSPDLHPLIAAEAEKAAGELAFYNNRAKAGEALALCRKLGGDPPTTRSVVLRVLKPFLPGLMLLLWQHRRRTRLRMGEKRASAAGRMA